MKKGNYKTYYDKSCGNLTIPRSTNHVKKRKLNEFESENFMQDDCSYQDNKLSLNVIHNNIDISSTNTNLSKRDGSLLESNFENTCFVNTFNDVDISNNTSTFNLSDDPNFDQSNIQECLQKDEVQEKLEKETCKCTKMNVAEILLIFLTITKKHSITWVALLDIFKALNFIFDKNIFPETKYMIRKLMDVRTESFTYHTLCRQCNKYMGSSKDVKFTQKCVCGSIAKYSSTGAFFIEIDIEDQLRKLFSINDVAKNLNYRFTRKKKDASALEDIYDGNVYKKLASNDESLKNVNNFSYTFNTDGCQAADHSKVSVWPIYLMIHELPDYLRKKYMVLAGLWVNDADPDMNVFLDPFVKQANKLSLQGLEWIKNGKKITSKIFPLGCCVDSVCRCALLNMKRFNGYYGCTFCEHPSERIDGNNKYPMLQKAPKLRTDKSIKDQMILAKSTSKDVMGVWGPSSLMNLRFFDLFKGMVVDFMHSCLLGVTELHTEILLTSVDKDYYVGSPSALNIIDKRLLSIKPPKCIGQVPRSIKDRNNWTASNWLAWNVFYSLPCLKGLIPDKYLNNLACFSTALTILLKDSISKEMLKVSKKLLIKYVFYFQEFFGASNMNYNVHLLLHVTDTVENWGPLWADNTFPFENENKNLLKMKKSNCNIAKQIGIRLLTYQKIPLLAENVCISKRTTDFCDTLTTQRLQKVCINKNCTLLGVGKNHILTSDEIDSLQRLLDVNKIKESKMYNKIIYNNCRFTINSRLNRSKTNNSVFETINKKFGIIVRICVIKYDNKSDVFIFYKPLCTYPVSFITDPDIITELNYKLCKLKNRVKCINYSKLHRSAIITNSSQEYYLSKIVLGTMGRCLN